MERETSTGLITVGFLYSGESVYVEDVKCRNMLSETKLGDSRSSLLNDKEDMESVRSLVSEHNAPMVSLVEVGPLCTEHSVGNRAG